MFSFTIFFPSRVFTLYTRNDRHSTSYLTGITNGGKDKSRVSLEYIYIECFYANWKLLYNNCVLLWKINFMYFCVVSPGWFWQIPLHYMFGQHGDSWYWAIIWFTTPPTSCILSIYICIYKCTYQPAIYLSLFLSLSLSLSPSLNPPC